MPRVVFDTVVLVRCLINPYGLWGRLVLQHIGAYRLVLSPPLLVEMLEVFRRPELTAKFRSLPTDLIAVLDILSAAEVVETPEIPAVSRDPDDDKVLAAAKVAQADYLVTEDQDLLVLGEYEGTQIVTAATFLRSLEAR